MRTMIVALAGMVLSAAAWADSTALDASFATQGLSSLVDADNNRTIAHFSAPSGGSVAVLYYNSTNSAVCPTGKLCLLIRRFLPNGVTADVPVNRLAIFDFIGGAAIDSVGRIVVVGSTLVSGSDYDFHFVRLNPDGSLDTNFSGDGIKTVAFDLGGTNYDLASAVAVDRSDRIVAVGRVQLSAVNTDFAVLRLLSNGEIDLIFGTSGRRIIAFDLAPSSFFDGASALVIGRDGKITIGGGANDSARGVTRIALARVLDSGQIDTSFCNTSCIFQGPYTAINNGRRVSFFGAEDPPRDDQLDSMTIDAFGSVCIAGLTQNVPAPASFAYLQRFSASGDFAGERSTNAAVAGQIRLGSVNYIAGTGAGTDRIVLTGVADADARAFFTQRFTVNLAPVANAGNQGAGNSVYVWTATTPFTGIGNVPAQSSIDPFGRILSGGAFNPSAAGTAPYGASMARLSVVNGARPDVIFRTNF